MNKFYLSASLFLGLLVIFCFNINIAQADFSSCGITPTNPQWQIKAPDTSVVLAIDNAGNMDITATNVHTGEAPSGSFSDSFIIKNSSGVDRFVFNKNDAYIPGAVIQNADQAQIDDISGDDLVVKNSSGANIVRFDAGSGNIYIKASACGVVIQITNCQELQDMQNNLSANYALANDIDCSDTINWNGGLGFDPILHFTGVFDGQNYTISDLFINRPLEEHVALFGYANGSEIKNVGLIDVDITGEYYVGGLAGYNPNTSITNSYVTGNISGYRSVGGLVGYHTGSSSIITNSYAESNVYGSERYVGGLVGYMNESSVEYSYATGNVSGNRAIGGLVGYTYTFSSIRHSYATGNVDGYRSIGGLVGNNSNDCSIENSYSIGSVTGVLSTKGGLLGVNSGSIALSYWNTDFNSGLLGCGSGDCTGASGLNTDQMTQEASYSNWDFQPPSEDTWKLSTLSGRYYPCLSWQDDGTCPVAAYAIANCQQLQDMQNDLDEDYILANDIDCSDTINWNGGAGFDPVGTFTGTLNGQGYEISDLYINRSSENFIGLFGYTDNGAEISNLGLTGANITGRWYTGGLVGYNTNGSDIENCYVTGSVNGTSGNNVGGLVGLNYLNFSTIDDSYSSATVTGTGSNIGGLVGGNDNYSIISDSYATGSVNGSSDVGGLLGDNNNGAVNGSYATGNVNGTGSKIGGLVGNNTFLATVNNSYAEGEVQCGTEHCGGLVGYNYDRADITNSYAIGNVNGNINVGGLVGGSQVSTDISNSYATGSVNGNTNVGGLAGINTGTINVSYWNTDFGGSTGCGSGDCTGATGLDTDQMTQEANYSGWDFQPPSEDTWKLSTLSGRYYPCLSWQDDGTCPVAAYAIANCQQLQDMQNDLDEDYIVVNDIDCSDTINWNGGLGFDPVGNNSNEFTGSLDGQGYEVQSLYINRVNEVYVGLFGFVDDGAEIENTGLKNIDVTGDGNVGGLVGYFRNSNIINSYATGIVEGRTQVGGLVGYQADNSEIVGCYSTVDVTGIVNLTGDGNVGGLVGVTYGTIRNSYATGDVNSADSKVGGLIGENNGSLINCYTVGMVTGSSFSGGLIGVNSGATPIDCYWNIQISGQAQACGFGDCTGATGLNTDQMTQESNYSGWDFQPPSEDTWKLSTLSGRYYPCLSWQDDGTCPVAPEMTGAWLYQGISCGSPYAGVDCPSNPEGKECSPIGSYCDLFIGQTGGCGMQNGWAVFVCAN